MCRQSVFVTCSKLASGRAILLGDAAHAMSANLGMACNVALQDSQVLSEACIAASGDVVASAQEYNQDRLGNVHAVARVSRHVDARNTFKYHRSLTRVLAALPYTLHSIALKLPPSMRIPGAHACKCSQLLLMCRVACRIEQRQRAARPVRFQKP